MPKETQPTQTEIVERTIKELKDILRPFSADERRRIICYIADYMGVARSALVFPDEHPRHGKEPPCPPST